MRFFKLLGSQVFISNTLVHQQIMQLLRDNLTLWTSDLNDVEQPEKDEVKADEPAGEPSV